MIPADFTANSPGTMIRVPSRTGQQGWAFVPHPLPRYIDMDHEMSIAAERAALALGNLNGTGRMIPNPTLLIRPFMRREALASSRIEGTRAEFEQLVMVEVAEDGEITDPDLQEVANYVAALHSGWYKPSERPFTPGLMMELHQQLLAGVRGSTKGPGSLRTKQVIIGSHNDDLLNARFVPPPPELVRELLEALCLYIESDQDIPSLVRLALIHYQFETIHPFMDGNGRLGRLLMPLILGIWGKLELPLLYLSEYFEEHREEYIDHLYGVSQRNAWKEWVLFTLAAIEQQSNDAVLRGQQLLQLREDFRIRYQSARSGSVLPIVDRLFERPALSVKLAMTYANISKAAAGKIIDRLVDDGILTEVTGQKRNRVFVAWDIVRVMSQRRPPSDDNVQETFAQSP